MPKDPCPHILLVWKRITWSLKCLPFRSPFPPWALYLGRPLPFRMQWSAAPTILIFNVLAVFYVLQAAGQTEKLRDWRHKWWWYYSFPKKIAPLQQMESYPVSSTFQDHGCLSKQMMLQKKQTTFPTLYWIVSSDFLFFLIQFLVDGRNV